MEERKHLFNQQAGVTDIHMQKNVGTFFKSLHRTILYTKPSVLEENIGTYLYDLGLGKAF